MKRHQPLLVSDKDAVLFRCMSCGGEFMYSETSGVVRCVHCQKNSARTAKYLDEVKEETRKKEEKKQNQKAVKEWVKAVVTKAWEDANDEKAQNMSASVHITPKGELVRVLVFSECLRGVDDLLDDIYVTRLTIHAKKESVLGAIVLEFLGEHHALSETNKFRGLPTYAMDGSVLVLTLFQQDEYHPACRWVVSPNW